MKRSKTATKQTSELNVLSERDLECVMGGAERVDAPDAHDSRPGNGVSSDGTRTPYPEQGGFGTA